jgi:hypothetical protein
VLSKGFSTLRIRVSICFPFLSSKSSLVYISVPVYDGRKGNFEMTKLGQLGQLSAWEGSLVGCICLVGYTANTWMSTERKQLSLNIQWVVVMGTL